MDESAGQLTNKSSEDGKMLLFATDVTLIGSEFQTTMPAVICWVYIQVLCSVLGLTTLQS